MKLSHRIMTMATAIALTTGGAIALETAQAPVAHASCYNGLTSMQAKNLSCKPEARHYVVVRNVGNKFGGWAKPGKISRQSVCWANITTYGMFLPA